MLEHEISIDNYIIMCRDRNRHKGDVVCYIRHDLRYKTSDNRNYLSPPSQNNFLELQNSNMNMINSVDNEIYILGDFNVRWNFTKVI